MYITHLAVFQIWFKNRRAKWRKRERHLLHATSEFGKGGFGTQFNSFMQPFGDESLYSGYTYNNWATKIPSVASNFAKGFAWGLNAASAAANPALSAMSNSWNSISNSTTSSLMVGGGGGGSTSPTAASSPAVVSSNMAAVSGSTSYGLPSYGCSSVLPSPYSIGGYGAAAAGCLPNMSAAVVGSAAAAAAAAAATAATTPSPSLRLKLSSSVSPNEGDEDDHHPAAGGPLPPDSNTSPRLDGSNQGCGTPGPPAASY